MKKLVVCLGVCAAFVMAGTTSASVTKSKKVKSSTSQEALQEQSARIDALEAELNGLKEKQAADAANKEKVGAKLPVKIYGFIDAQFIWGDSTVTTLGSTTNSYVAITDAANDVVTPMDDAFFGATAQNTRIGLDWLPTKVGKVLTVGGKIEMDFLNPGGGNSPRPRMRLAYAYLEGKHWQLLGGQEWDVFSPLNTATQQIGSNLWFGGNLGFRRPQLKFTYSIPCCDNAAIKLIASINNPGNVDTVMNNTNTAGWPYGEASVLFTKPMNDDTFTAAISGVLGRENTPVRNINIWGLAASLKWPVHRFFKPAGEFQYGVDLGDFLSNCGLGARRRVIAGWGQITSQWHKMLQTNIGYGVETLKTDQVAVGSVLSNQFGFANLWFNPVKPFGIGLEYDHIRTRYNGNGVSTANVIMGSTKFDF